MRVFKQLVLTAIVVVAALAAWAVYVPEALPLLDRLGLLRPLGLERPAPEDRSANGGGPGDRVAVVAQEVGEVPFIDQLAAIGDGRADHSVTLMPEVSGMLVALPVQSGSHVAAGDVVARLENDVQTIALERDRLALSDARDTLERFERLGTSGAVTELQRRSADYAVKTAELAVKQSEFELSRRLIVAPISGWVGLIAAQVGDQVTPATVLAQIDDRRRIIVEFRVPERFVGQLAPGDVLRALPLAQPDREFAGRITALDNRVDPGSRMLRVQAALDNADDSLRPGMAFRIEMSFLGERFAAVDPLAIQWSGEGAYVWRLTDDVAHRVPVSIVQRNSDAVLVRADLHPGDIVVTEGVQNLRPGSRVSIATRLSAEQGGGPTTGRGG